MKTGTAIPALALLALAACNVTTTNNDVASPTNEEAPSAPATPAPGNESGPPAPGKPGGLADDRTPLEEPKGPIDPKSAEAAGQVVQQYAALVEEGRFAAAEKLWNDPGMAAKASARLKPNRENHFEIGKPGDPEGAAGSIYVTVPVVHYGKDAEGKSFSHKGEIALRRVNDVPGSTAEQRRWHIQSLTF